MLQLQDLLLLLLLLSGSVFLLAGDLRDYFVDQGWLPGPDQGARGGNPPASKAPRRAPPASVLPQVADLLLVDDSAVARAKLRRLFEKNRYDVHLACDGAEALAMLQNGRYALMITDLEMPNVDGIQLINTCLSQAHTARMPIIAISGHENLRARFNECRDICGVHRKPWADDILLSHVATLVPTRMPRAAAAMA